MFDPGVTCVTCVCVTGNSLHIAVTQQESIPQRDDIGDTLVTFASPFHRRYFHRHGWARSALCYKVTVRNPVLQKLSDVCTYFTE